jgi:hypothetical protein
MFEANVAVVRRPEPPVHWKFGAVLEPSEPPVNETAVVFVQAPPPLKLKVPVPAVHAIVMLLPLVPGVIALKLIVAVARPVATTVVFAVTPPVPVK